MRNTPLVLMILGLLAIPSTALADGPQPASVSTIPDITGTWAQLQVTTAVSSIPIIGDIITTTTTVLLLDAQQFQDKAFLTETVCNINITSNSSSLRTIIPVSFLKAVSGKTRQATLTPQGSKLQFHQKRKLSVLGARLSNTSREKLPTTPKDPRIRDPDRDGKPGVTVKVRGIIDGSVYVVQRGWNELIGTMSHPDYIQGAMRWKSEQNTVDATSIFLKAQPGSKPYKGKKHNYFRMRRVSKNMTCAQAIQNRRALFTPSTP